MPTKKKKPASAAAPVSTPASALNLVMLAAIVAAGPNGGFFSEADATALANNNPPLVEVNTTLKNEAGDVATRATQAGIDFAAKQSTPKTEAVKPTFNIISNALPPVVERGSHLKPRESVFPFDKLPDPTFAADGTTLVTSPSFFVPKSEKYPDPAKNLASTVSSATRRFSHEDGTRTVSRPVAKKNADGSVVTDANGDIVYETDANNEIVKADVQIPKMVPDRQFVIRAIEDGAAWGYPGQSGAAIYRVK